MNYVESNAESIVNIEKYPIHDKRSTLRQSLVTGLKAELEENLFCVLPDFIRADALQAMKDEALLLRPQANDNTSRRNCYLQPSVDAALPADHARNLMNNASSRIIPYKLLTDHSPLKAFYHWSAVRELVAEIVGDVPLFDNEDEYQPANYVCYNNGDQSSWHFDSVNAFTMTLMVQAAESGGDFELSPESRSDNNQNYEHVAKILKGELDESTVSVGREPGALYIFRGCNSLHRVSPVAGDTMRIMGVFVYETQPGVVGDPEVNETVYGASRQ